MLKIEKKIAVPSRKSVLISHVSHHLDHQMQREGPGGSSARNLVSFSRFLCRFSRLPTIFSFIFFLFFLRIVLNSLLIDFFFLFFFQEEFGEGDNPVTSQPNAGQATSNMPVFAMPPPSATNPFANETSNLNQGGQRTYTPGERF